MTFDRDIIMAYVDGELDLVTAKRIERAAEHDAALAKQIADQRALKARLAAHFDPVLGEVPPARLTSPLTAGATQLAAPRRRFAWPTMAAMAASLALGLVVGPQIFAPASGPLALRGETIVADGALAQALDTQLASTQTPSAEVRIGLTFQDKSGAVCRSFESAAISGIACREDGSWGLRQAKSGTARSTFRQAAADDLIEDIDAMRAGDIADSAIERTWQANGWTARDL